MIGLKTDIKAVVIARFKMKEERVEEYLITEVVLKGSLIISSKWGKSG